MSSSSPSTGGGTGNDDPSPGPTIAVGFGDNYFCQMGPATPTLRPPPPPPPHQQQSAEETTTPTTTPATTLSPEPVISYQFSPDSLSSFSQPPWAQEDDELVSVSCTITSSYFLTKSGKIWHCGTMHGTICIPLTKKVIALPLKCVQIATGRQFCLARMEGGLAVCAWGASHFGQLGLGNECPPFVDQPTVVEALLPHVVGSPVTSVAAGYWHSMASTQAGQVYAWGANRNSQCGVKPSKEPPTITIPQRVRFDHIDSNIRIEKIAAGRSHSVVLDQNGQVYAFGANQYAQCGALTRRKGGIAPPKHVEALTRVRIVGISAGDAHTLTLTGGGRVFSFGAGSEGQLGIGLVITLNPKPKLVGDLDFVAIEAGREWKTKQQQQKQQLQRSDQNSAGKNTTSSTEQSTEKTSPPTPGPEMLASIPKIIHITAKGNSSFALSSTGQVYSWGCNDCCNLGIAKPDQSMLDYVDAGMPPPKSSTARQLQTYSFDSSHNLVLPKRVDALKDLKVTSLAAAPTFLWCLGTKRETHDHPDVGRTLYEIQELKRLELLQPRQVHDTKKETSSPRQMAATNMDSNRVSSPKTPSSIPTVPGENPSTPSQLDPPGVKNDSQVEAGSVGWTRLGAAPSGDNNKDETVLPSTSEGPATEEASSDVVAPVPKESDTDDVTTTTGAATSNSPPPSTNVTPSRKKRMFSPKKLVKAIVRRASGNANKPSADLPAHTQLDDEK